MSVGIAADRQCPSWLFAEMLTNIWPIHEHHMRVLGKSDDIELLHHSESFRKSVMKRY